MMKDLLNVLHPTFETLSAFADERGASSRMSRTARHIEKCDVCRAAVQDIHTMGCQARDLDFGAASATVWKNIEGGLHSPALAPSSYDDLDTRENASIARVSGARFSARRGAMVFAACAAALLAVLLWPSSQKLHAVSTNRLTFSPQRPVPGGLLTIRYFPEEKFKGAKKLLLGGRYTSYATERVAVQPLAPYRLSAGVIGDSLATLLPTGDGFFEARLHLPVNFLALSLSVIDSSREHIDANGGKLFWILGGQRDGTPSRAAMLSVISGNAGFTSMAVWQNDSDINWAVDSMIKYFPSDPAGWAAKNDYGVRKGTFDYLAFFQTAERKYAQLSERLSPQPTLDAEHIVAMANFAARISEPDLFAAWVRRLAKEHPTDPNVYHAVLIMLHDIELRTPPKLADSIAPWLPVILDAFGRTSADMYSFDEGTTFLQHYGTPLQQAQWISLYGLREFRLMGSSFPMRDSALKNISKSDERDLLGFVSGDCAVPVGKLSIAFSETSWKHECWRDRVRSLATLSQSYRLRKNFPEALRYADSARVADARATCNRGYWGQSAAITARARMDLGDVKGATEALVVPFRPEVPALYESAKRILGARYDSLEVNRVAKQVRPAVPPCEAKSIR